MKLHAVIVAILIVDAFSISMISVPHDNETLALAAVNIVENCFGSSERWSELLIISDQTFRRGLEEINRAERTSNLIVNLNSARGDVILLPEIIIDNCNTTVQWCKSNPAVVIITARSAEQLESKFSFLKNDIQTVWQPRSAFLVISENGCSVDESNRMFKVIWDYWILNAVILCSPRDPGNKSQSEIELFTFNPYSADHSERWETIIHEIVQVSITPGNFNHSWYIFKRRFTEIRSSEDCGDIFFDKTLNLDGYMIPISIGYSEFSLDEFLSKPQKLFAPDSRMLKTLAKKLGFKVIEVPNNHAHVYGQLLRNGSFTGILSDVYSRRSHLVVANRAMLLYPGLEMTYPHGRTGTCIASLISRNRPQWMSLLDAKNIWIAFGLGVIFITAVQYLQNKSLGIVSACLDGQRLIVGNSITRTPKMIKHRIILGSILLVVLVVDGAIRGRFISILTAVKLYPNLETLEQIREQEIDIYGHPNFKKWLPDSKLKARFNTNLRYSECLASLRHEKRKRICLVECRYLRLAVHGLPNIHGSSVPILSYYFGYLTTMHWPLTDRYSFDVQKLVEANIFGKWQADVVRESEMAGWKLKRAKDSPYVKPTKLNDLLPAFILLFVGLSVAMIVFVWEMKDDISSRCRIEF